MSKYKKFKTPDWMKLDNAATIYPSTLSRRYAAMFRMSITLTERIDKGILNEALNNVIKRFPAFRYKLKKGIFKFGYISNNSSYPYYIGDTTMCSTQQ
jgi:hypothetical protein